MTDHDDQATAQLYAILDACRPRGYHRAIEITAVRAAVYSTDRAGWTVKLWGDGEQGWRWALLDHTSRQLRVAAGPYGDPLVALQMAEHVRGELAAVVPPHALRCPESGPGEPDPARCTCADDGHGRTVPGGAPVMCRALDGPSSDGPTPPCVGEE